MFAPFCADAMRDFCVAINILGFRALDLSINQLPYVNVTATFLFSPECWIITEQYTVETKRFNEIV